MVHLKLTLNHSEKEVTLIKEKLHAKERITHASLYSNRGMLKMEETTIPSLTQLGIQQENVYATILLIAIIIKSMC